MAEIAFVRVATNVEGDVYKAETITAGDTTSVLKVNGAEDQITVHAYGTVGGTTLTVQGSLDGVQFNTLDDAYGQALSLTAIGVVKPVGPNVNALRVVSTGGSGVDIDVDVYIVTKQRS